MLQVVIIPEGRGRVMFSLTAPDGSSVSIDGSLVVRARRAIDGEQLSSGVKTRIDWVQMQLAREPLNEVIAAILDELKTFVFLTSRDGSRIWFNAAKAMGPLPLTPSQEDGVVHSSLKLMGYRQYVVESPENVRSLLKNNGGVALP